MTDKNKPKLTVKLKRGGQRVKHGGWSFLVRGELPENRKHVLRYLTAARENLIKDLGPTEEGLTTAQIIIIDRIVSKLGVIRCIEEYIRENTVMVGQSLAPSLKASYLAYNNSLRLDLQALGINSKKADEFPNPLEYAKKKYGKKAQEALEKEKK